MGEGTAGTGEALRLLVAVDGPAGAGKGTICRELARHFGWNYLDTGAIYRAVALLSLRRGVTQPDTLANLAAEMPFSFRPGPDGAFRAFLGEEDVSLALRDERVGEAASKVAVMPAVRQALLTFQRRYRELPEGAILDGRDVGTVVFPDADFKLFVTASLEERARRRALELQERGEAVSFPNVLAAMARRDERDSGRAHAPLVPADDAKVLDTTGLTPAQCVERVIQLLSTSTSHPGL